MRSARSDKEKKIGMREGSLVERGNGPDTALRSSNGLVNGPPMGPGTFRPKTRKPVSQELDDSK